MANNSGGLAELPDSVIPEAVPTGYAWLAGAVGTGVFLSLGEVADRASVSLDSFVNGVADLLVGFAVNGTPEESTYSVLLLGGIAFVFLAVGGWLGTIANRSRAVLPLGFLLFGLLGGLATTQGEGISTGQSWAIAIGAAAVGVAIALSLLEVQTSPKPATQSIASSVLLDRRTLLTATAAAGTIAIAAAARLGRTVSAEVAREEILADIAEATAAQRGASLPIGDLDGLTGITPRIVANDDFYIIDTAFRKPEIDAARWALTIDGPHVDNPTTFTYQDLLNRELVTTEMTLVGVSNPLGGDLVGNAVWTGVPLAELLDEAGIADPTNPNHQIFSRSVDDYTSGFPVPIAYDGRTAMLALFMNGEPLPTEHGFPARLVVAGLYGYVSAIKWIEQIQVTDFEGVDGFWIPRGWSKEAPVKTQSRIDTPEPGAEMAPGPVTIAGVAWNPGVGIDQVEVGFTNAATQETTEWIPAQLAESGSDETWVQWQFEWDAPDGEWFIAVRATDKSGFTQTPEQVPAAPNGAEGHHTILSRVR